MDELSVGGKDYVKASVIARDLGYTADYVGQLCRSRKVNAKLVGRSWYVDRNSIHTHRTNRYRSTQTKSKESLREEVEVVHSSEKGVRVPVQVLHFYTRTSTPITTKVSYAEDQAELIPAVSKTPRSASLEVGLADAKSVGVVSKDADYTFQTPSLPKIQFQGSLIVSNIEDGTDTESTERRVIHPNGTSKNKAENIDSSSVHISVIEASLQQSEKKDAPDSINAKEAHVSVAVVEEKTQSSSALYFAVTVMSFAFAMLLMGLEAQISVVDQTVTTSYSFGIDNLTASAYASIDDAKNFFSLVEFSTNFFIF